MSQACALYWHLTRDECNRDLTSIDFGGVAQVPFAERLALFSSSQEGTYTGNDSFDGLLAPPAAIKINFCAHVSSFAHHFRSPE